ncbi:FKBP-type peptidyl-prolyl cis-trans isomerase [uncultured Porphyromonas sp.]|jgi:FKBP-type peptidyl-prolyl cis-trans isomerase|uniref:FKBP-type peptidyl-prolyl cis-trans isomerase n=1 Tax=uncultured Porphyromonas sp. TaxID=159274 RepID=UPI00261BE9FF|nr:FKBP-type peptidyl-prolyl cis-trans isomerase [uncultured Porphyromonas sp.]
MKKSILSLLAVVAMVCAFASCNKTAQKSDTNNELSAMTDSVAMIQGYMTGQQLGQQFMMMAMQGMPVDTVEFLKGFKKGIADTTKFSYYAGQIQGVQTAMGLAKEGIDTKIFAEYLEYALKGDTTKMTMDQEAAYNYIQNYYSKKQEIENKEKYGKNIDEGKKAIEDFAKQDDVITTESGLAYRYATKGTGKSPVDGDKVKVTYRGTLVNGTEFDKSEEPVEFGVNQVIPGWTELLKLMKEGDQVIAYIPYDLAYGANGSGSSIEPFSTLIFDVTLLEVIPAEKK